MSSVSPSVMAKASLGNETNEWLASAMDNPLDVGIVLDGLSSSNCGHQFKLAKLIQYLTIDCHNSSHHNTTDKTNNESTLKTGTGSTCPICHAPIVVVEDGLAHNNDKCNNNDSLLFFKYGKHYYRLCLDNNSRNRWQSWWYGSNYNNSLAQRRIADVLHVKSLRILCKGKVVYPDATKSEVELSRMLLTMSQHPLDKKANNNNQKPSLVVMGTRIGHELPLVKTSGWFMWMVSWCYQWLCAMLQWTYRQVALRHRLPPPHQD